MSALLGGCTVRSSEDDKEICRAKVIQPKRSRDPAILPAIEAIRNGDDAALGEMVVNKSLLPHMKWVPTRLIGARPEELFVRNFDYKELFVRGVFLVYCSGIFGGRYIPKILPTARMEAGLAPWAHDKIWRVVLGSSYICYIKILPTPPGLPRDLANWAIWTISRHAWKSNFSQGNWTWPQHVPSGHFRINQDIAGRYHLRITWSETFRKRNQKTCAYPQLQWNYSGLKEAPAGIASAFWKLDPVLSCIFFVVCGESSQCEDICQTSANHYNPLRKFIPYAARITWRWGTKKFPHGRRAKN